MSQTPSISLTQDLANLRIQFANLLDAHGATQSELQQRTAELEEAERRTDAASKTIDSLEAKVIQLSDVNARRDALFDLKEREISSLTALLVCAPSPCWPFIKIHCLPE